MSKLEVFQNGVFSNTGEPVFQIGTKKEDGTYDISVYALMSKEQAEAKLNELQPAPAKPTKPKAKKAREIRTPSKTDLAQLTKLELEEEMRGYGLELDRRKTKSALVKESLAFLNGK
jgi:hypothetical protein